MNRNFNKAGTQGILGALCILCASASFLASDQSVFWIVRTLAWLFALTFFHYALIRAQELSNANVFTIFKYAYNGFLAVILCTVALYVFDKKLSKPHLPRHHTAFRICCLYRMGRHKSQTRKDLELRAF